MILPLLVFAACNAFPNSMPVLPERTLNQNLSPVSYVFPLYVRILIPLYNVIVKYKSSGITFPKPNGEIKSSMSIMPLLNVTLAVGVCAAEGLKKVKGGLSFERIDEGDWQDKALQRDVAVLIA